MIRDLKKRADSLRSQFLIEEGALRSAEQSLALLETQITTLTKEIGILGQVDAALNEISSRVMSQSTSTIDKMLTTGLRFVFDDVNLEFKTTVSKYRGKTSVKFSLFQDGKEAPIMDSYGGGVVVVAGVLLRVVTIMSLQGRRVLFLDETLAHVSHQYVPRVSQFLNRLCKELSFDILMITHNPEFAEYANCHFKTTSTKDAGTIFTKVTQSSGGSNDD